MGAKVFDIAELLEMVLFNLPMVDLLRSQRVNKQFKSMIDGSEKLQRALFFLPAPRQVSNEQSISVPIKPNPLLVDVFEPSPSGHNNAQLAEGVAKWNRSIKIGVQFLPKGMEHASCMRMYLCQSPQPIRDAVHPHYASQLRSLANANGRPLINAEYCGETLGKIWKRLEKEPRELLAGSEPIRRDRHAMRLLHGRRWAERGDGHLLPQKWALPENVTPYE